MSIDGCRPDRHADRLLIATAIELACPLITYDARITRFAQSHGSQYGFTIGA